MTLNQDGVGSPVERELQYYRRECNELGARLLRLQEEQSQAFLEARRSRTVVRLIREAYRLAEPTQAAEDVGGLLLQIIVENALCDRAAMLREEPAKSGRFLLAHAIAGAGHELNDVTFIENPPNFYFTSSLRFDRPPAGLTDVLRLPYILWAYDKSSGHALILGNRSESNITRPFESGDQELIEAALTVYLDVLYRKHAEVRLRQAKQSVEEASRAQSDFLAALAAGLQPPIERIQHLLTACNQVAATGSAGGVLQKATLELTRSSNELLLLANGARVLATSLDGRTRLNLQWAELNGLVRSVYRAAYPISVRGGIDLSVTLPPRSVSVCVDRDELHTAIKTIVSDGLARAATGSQVRLAAVRRGDGDAEIVVSVMNEAPSPFPVEWMPAPAQGGTVAGSLIGPGPDRVMAARRIIEAHEAILVTERRAGSGSQSRIIFPASITRDETPTA